MKFRQWCHEKWYEHCDEVEAWTGQRVNYLSREYFNKYKWWLKREFQNTVRQRQTPKRPEDWKGYKILRQYKQKQQEDFSPYNTTNS